MVAYAFFINLFISTLGCLLGLANASHFCLSALLGSGPSGVGVGLRVGRLGFVSRAAWVGPGPWPGFPPKYSDYYIYKGNAVFDKLLVTLLM